MLFKTRIASFAAVVLALASGFARADWWWSVYTPRYSRVQVFSRTDELTPAQAAQIRQYTLASFPSARIIGDPTTRQNCHSWAWQARVSWSWMNDPSAYWRDGSYRQVSLSNLRYGTRVTYSNMFGTRLQHSAFARDFFWYYSKWGAWCYMLHRPLDVPAIYGTYHRYYNRAAF